MNLEINKIKSSIKILLKNAKLSYSDLAIKLEVSEPTIKRVLGQEELSLSRLLKICDVLSVSLSELEEMAKINSQKEGRFTVLQENFLAKNPSFLNYLVHLQSGMTPVQIKEEYNLTELRNTEYLVQLEKYELIRVTDKGTVKTVLEDFGHFGDGVLARLYAGPTIELSHDFFKTHSLKVLDNDESQSEKDSKQIFSLKSFKVTKKTYNDFVDEQLKSSKDFCKRAEIEEKTLDDSELMTVVLSEGFALVENDSPLLSGFKNHLGEIK